MDSDKIAHLLRVILYQYPENENKYMYICGSNLIKAADTYEELLDAPKLDILPAIFYYPPHSNDNGLISAVCTGPIQYYKDDGRSGFYIGPETYDYHPYQVRRRTHDNILDSIITFIMYNNQLENNGKCYLSKDVIREVIFPKMNTTTKFWIDGKRV